MRKAGSDQPSAPAHTRGDAASAAVEGPEIDDFSAPSRRIWGIAGPAILAGSSTPLAGLVDTWAIGRSADTSALAAIGVGASLFSFLYLVFGFLRMGTTGLVAQARGREDGRALEREIARLLVLPLLLGLILLLLQAPILSAGLTFLQTPDTVRGDAALYSDIRIFSAPFTFMVFTLNGIFIGLERTRTTLMMMLVMNGANILINITLVVGFGMGAEGVAIGTLAAEIIAAGFGLFMLGLLVSPAGIIRAVRSLATYAPSALIKPLQVNGLLFLRTVLLLTAFVLVTRQAATLGSAALAASHVIGTFLMLISLGLDGFAHAAESLSGNAFGAGNRRAFRRWSLLSGLWAAVTALVYAAVFWVFGAVIVAVITDLDDVRRAAEQALPILSPLPLAAFVAYHMDGIFVGATASAAMLVTMAISFLAFFAALQPLTAAYGLAGLWGAMAILMLVRGITQLLWYPKLEAQLG